MIIFEVVGKDAPNPKRSAIVRILRIQNRDGSSLFFLARVELEPIFIGSGQAWATDFVSQAYASQKNCCSSLLRASKIPIKVDIC